MTRKEFEELIKTYKQFDKVSNALSKVGLDVFEGDNPIADSFYKVSELVITSHYTEEGVEWIFWWIYENNFGKNELPAYDEDENLICQTEDELYNYIKQYKKC